MEVKRNPPPCHRAEGYSGGSPTVLGGAPPQVSGLRMGAFLGAGDVVSPRPERFPRAGFTAWSCIGFRALLQRREAQSGALRSRRRCCSAAVRGFLQYRAAILGASAGGPARRGRVGGDRMGGSRSTQNSAAGGSVGRGKEAGRSLFPAVAAAAAAEGPLPPSCLVLLEGPASFFREELLPCAR